MNYEQGKAIERIIQKINEMLGEYIGEEKETDINVVFDELANIKEDLGDLIDLRDRI